MDPMEESDFLFHVMARAIRDRLKAYSFFNNIPVHCYYEQDPLSELTKSTNSAGGILVLVWCVGGESSAINAQGAFWNPLRFVVGTLEDPVLNRAQNGSKKTGDNILAVAAGLLNHHTLIDEGGSKIQSRLAPQGISSVANPDYIEWRLDLESQGGLVVSTE